MPNFDPRYFRTVCGEFATGVTVVTSGKAPAFHGMTANAFTSLSLDPPLILICVDKNTHMLKTLRETPAFTVNILATDQQNLSNYFAKSDRNYGPAEFTDINLEYELGETGAPRIAGAIGYMDCTVHDIAPGGDHEIYIGEVKACWYRSGAAPLIFFEGSYREIAPKPD